MTSNWIRPFFLVAGLYDAILGLIFFFGHNSVFAYFEVTPPNHPAYVEFPALLLIVFGAMFLQISTDPVRLRPLIPYGIALKAAYSGIAFWYYFNTGISSMWMPWAWLDLAFIAGFCISWMALAPNRASS